MTPAGLMESQAQIKLGGTYFIDEAEFPVIDHMHFQDDHTVAGEWLFGTTRSHRLD